MQDKISNKNKVCFHCDMKLDKNFIKIPHEDKYFHPDHLECEVCQVNLKNGFYEENEKMYCEECYNQFIVLKCFVCKKNIDDDFSKINNHYYHANCIKCDSCHLVLKENYYLRNQKFFCETCHQKESDVCFKCEKRIEDYMYGTDEGDNFHEDCFKCEDCNRKLKKNEFVLFERKCYHKECFEKNHAFKCVVCHKLIDGYYYCFSNQFIDLECIEEFHKRMN